VFPGRFVEVGEKLLEAPFRVLVSFDFAVPASSPGVGDELVFGAQALSDAGGAVAGGDEFGAGEHEVAFAGSLGWEAQAVPEFEFGFQEVGLEPVHGLVVELAGEQVSAAGPAMRVPWERASSYWRRTSGSESRE
jgi:hypothetical protein